MFSPIRAFFYLPITSKQVLIYAMRIVKGHFLALP